MAAPHPRIIVEVEGGMVTAIYCDGVDLTAIPVFLIDHDCEGQETVPFGEDEVAMDVLDIEMASDDISRAARQAYDNWSMS